MKSTVLAVGKAVIATQQFDTVEEHLQARGLNDEQVVGWVQRQCAASNVDGSTFLAGVLFGIEMGRIVSDPAWGLDAVNPNQMHTDDLRGDADR